MRRNKKARTGKALTSSTSYGIDLSDEVFNSSSDLLSLSDYILSGILLSGYLSTYEVLKVVRLICRQCNALVQKFMGVVDLSIETNKKRICCNLDHKKQMSGILMRSKMLQYVDLSYAHNVKKKIFPKLCDLIDGSNNKNIRYLSLRGTSASDKSLLGIATYSSLMYLDISKSSSLDITSIGDSTVMSLANLSNLHWLNISGTSVSVDGISALSTGSCRHSLKYLGIQQCVWLTGEVCIALRRFSLVVLDISGILGLTDADVNNLVDPDYPLVNALTTINISFCHELTCGALSALQQCPLLSYIECRRSNTSTIQYCKDYLQHAGSMFHYRSARLVIISEHEDQIQTPRKFGSDLRDIYSFSLSSLFGSHARRRKLCDLACFPYDSMVAIIRKNAAECESDMLIQAKSQSQQSQFAGGVTDVQRHSRNDDCLSPVGGSVASQLFTSSSATRPTSGVNIEELLPKDSFKLHVAPVHL